MTSNPSNLGNLGNLGKICGTFINVKYIYSKFQTFEHSISEIHLKDISGDIYEIKFDINKICCETLMSNINTNIIPSKLEYFYMRSPINDLSNEFKYNVYFVHKNGIISIFEVINNHDGNYPHSLTLTKNGELIFKTYI